MSKRYRSLGVHYGDSDISVTTHAIKRFRARVKAVPFRQVKYEIQKMLHEVEPIRFSDGSSGRVFLAHKLCVFVMTRSGVITTVLPPRHSDKRFAESIKDERRRKQRLDKMRELRKSRSRRIAFQQRRRQRENDE